MSDVVTKSVVYVGADDIDIDLFESQYIVPKGISYNSYVILDDKIAVMDTIDGRKVDEWTANLEKVLNGKQPDYLVVQHMEPDHASGIGVFAEKYPNAKIVATAKAIQMMPQFFDCVDFDGRTMAVKEGDTLSLGAHTLHFVLAPMVHWPEVMVSYEDSEKILFSADAFGTFGALCYETEWMSDARRYFINIVGKYGAQVQTLLKKAAGLDIAKICPLHGPVLTDNLSSYICYYDTWSSYRVEARGVVVAHASIHGNTAKVAHRMAELLRGRGVCEVVELDLCRDDVATAVELAFKYDTLLLAASSYDAGVFTPMHEFLYRLQIKNFQKRRVGIIENGSWAPSAGRVMKAMLAEMKNIEIVEPMVTIKSSLKESDVPQLENLANELLKG